MILQIRQSWFGCTKYQSIWTIRSVIDVVIDLIPLKNKYLYYLSIKAVLGSKFVYIPMTTITVRCRHWTPYIRRMRNICHNFSTYYWNISSSLENIIYFFKTKNIIFRHSGHAPCVQHDFNKLKHSPKCSAKIGDCNMSLELNANAYQYEIVHIWF